MREATTPQQLIDSGLSGTALANAILGRWNKLPEPRARALLDQEVEARVWHGTRRQESIEDLKRNGFCSYTKEQAVDWLAEASQRLCEKLKAGPRVCQSLDRRRASILLEVSQPYRGKFSVTGIEPATCGEDEPENLMGGWADRNPEFVWDFLYGRATPKVTDEILTEMFGRPLKVELRVKVKTQWLVGPQDIQLEQRCFKPDEIVNITPCPPKVKRARAIRKELKE